MTEGSCLCGAVRFAVEAPMTEIGMCHCSKCRKVSGVASNAVIVASGSSLRWISGEDEVTHYAMADGWGISRCRTCGSPVPRRHPLGDAWFVPAGLLDGDPGVRVAMHIWIGSKAPWDEITDARRKHVEGLDSERVG